MKMTSSSLSYFFISLAVILFLMFCYFKVLVMNTGENSKRREKIIGKMKDPATWRAKNNAMSYVFLFWTIASVGIFIYLKYYMGMSLVNGLYLLAYLALIVISVIVAGMRRKSKA